MHAEAERPADPETAFVRESTPLSHPDALQSEQLFAGRREVLIEHAGQIYRLRLTRNGKLILHK